MTNTQEKLPSDYLPVALQMLGLEGIEDWRIHRWKCKADDFHKFETQHLKRRGSKPNVTMAAYVRMNLPFNVPDTGVRVDRTSAEIGKAFGCSDAAIKDRVAQVKREG